MENTGCNISSMTCSVSSPDETPRRELKIRRAAEYFWRTSRCFIWWWNTVSNTWYCFSKKMILERELKDAKMSSFSSDFQTLVKHQFPLYFRYELLMSLRSEDWRYEGNNEQANTRLFKLFYPPPPQGSPELISGSPGVCLYLSFPNQPHFHQKKETAGIHIHIVYQVHCRILSKTCLSNLTVVRLTIVTRSSSK